eukprot:940358-Pleurochrysis_carterae.AAC.2
MELVGALVVKWPRSNNNMRSAQLNSPVVGSVLTPVGRITASSGAGGKRSFQDCALTYRCKISFQDHMSFTVVSLVLEQVRGLIPNRSMTVAQTLPSKELNRRKQIHASPSWQKQSLYLQRCMKTNTSKGEKKNGRDGEWKGKS